jgi:hypothetical protein
VGLTGWLDRLDRRLLPPLRAALRAALRRADTAAGRLGSWRPGAGDHRARLGRRLSRAPGHAPRPARLGSVLDRRLARYGPFRLVRDTPALGLLTVAVVLVAGGVAAGVVRPRPAVRPSAQPAPAAVAPAALRCGLSVAAQGSAYVGPTPGASVSSYLAVRRRMLLACARLRPRQLELAVVSFAAPVTPAAFVQAAAGAQLFQLYLDLGGAGLLATEPTAATRPATGVPAALAAVVRQFQRAAAVQSGLAADITSRAPQQRADAAYFQRLAGADRAAAERLAAGLPCIYAALVDQSLGGLLQLSERPTVRLVDLAPIGTTVSAATIVPLAPGDTVTASGLPPRSFGPGQPPAGAQPGGNPASQGDD